MKNLISACFLILGALLLSTPSQGQIDDSLPPWFMDPAKILTLKAMDWNATYTLQNGRQAISRSKTTALAGKKVKISSGVKLLKGPITIKRDGNCYQVGCESNRSCNNCQMLWKDLNGDRKIQPKRELRCFCPKSGDVCALRGRNIECK